MKIHFIAKYTGLYGITEEGQIWSCPKKHGNSNRAGFWMKQNKDGCGYLFVALYNNGVKKQPKVHRLVAETFILNPLNLKEVNHVDGNKLNNKASNLEWCSSSENKKHAFRLGLRNQDGEANPSAKLTRTQVIEIRTLYCNGVKQNKIAKTFNIHPVTVHGIIKKKAWKHLLQKK